MSLGVIIIWKCSTWQIFVLQEMCFVIIPENYIQIKTIEHVTAFKMLCIVNI